MIEKEFKELENKYHSLKNLTELLKVRLRAFEELAKIINSDVSIEEALNTTLDLILNLFKVPSGSIMLLDRSGRDMEISVSRGEKAEEIKKFKVKLGEGIAGKVAQTGKPVIVNDVVNNPDFNKEIGEKINYIPKNIICVPIKNRDKILGVIEILDKGGKEKEFTEDDVNLLMSISNTLGVILENVKLYNISNSTLKKLTTLIEVSKIINTTIELEKLLDYIMETAKEVLNSEGSSLMLIDESTNELYFNITAGKGSNKLKEVRLPIGQGIAGIVAKEGKPLIVDDAINDPRVYKVADEVTKTVTRNILAVPMRVQDKIIGVLEVVNSKGRDKFDKYDLELFQAFADQAAIAIHNRDLINNLQQANDEIKRRYTEIKALYELSNRVTHEVESDKLFNIAVDVISNIFNIERVSIMLYEEEEGVLKIEASIGIREEIAKKVKLKPGEGIAGKVFKERESILVEDMDKDRRFGRNKKLRYKSKSFLSVPIKFRNKIIGVLNATDKKDKRKFDKNDLLTFMALSNQIGQSYENIIYYNEFLEKQQIEKEIEITKKIQQHVLPKRFPRLEGIDIAAVNIPAREVGGDFYDYISIDDNVHSFLIADVSGKSLPASMFMAFARSITRVEATNLVSPSRVLEESNKYIFKDSQSGMFVTMFYMVLYLKDKLIKFGSAGHNEQLFYREEKDDFELLNVKGIPLGISDSSIYMESSFNYNAGDILILYTDGITEAMNKYGEEFEMERLKEVVLRNKNLSANGLKNKILEAVNKFTEGMPQFDDITLLILKFV